MLISNTFSSGFKLIVMYSLQTKLKKNYKSQENNIPYYPIILNIS